MPAYNSLQFYMARADQARAEGEAATLDHVRERCRRSEEAWSQLARRAQRAEAARSDAASKTAELPDES